MSDEEPESDSVGVAVCKPDGTIQLMLRAVGPGGVIGESMATYAKDHPQYDEIRQHLGGIRPGENKPIPPFD